MRQPLAIKKAHELCAKEKIIALQLFKTQVPFRKRLIL